MNKIFWGSVFIFISAILHADDSSHSYLANLAESFNSSDFRIREKSTREWDSYVKSVKTTEEGIALAKWVNEFIENQATEEQRSRLTASPATLSRLKWFELADHLKMQPDQECMNFLASDNTFSTLLPDLLDSSMPFSKEDLLVTFFEKIGMSENCRKEMANILKPIPPHLWRLKLLTHPKFKFLGDKLHDEETPEAAWIKAISKTNLEPDVFTSLSFLTLKYYATREFTSYFNPVIECQKIQPILQKITPHLWKMLKDSKVDDDSKFAWIHLYYTVSVEAIACEEYADTLNQFLGEAIKNFDALKNTRMLKFLFDGLHQSKDRTNDSVKTLLKDLIERSPIETLNLLVRNTAIQYYPNTPLWLIQAFQKRARALGEIPESIEVLMRGPEPAWDLFAKALHEVPPESGFDYVRHLSLADDIKASQEVIALLRKNFLNALQDGKNEDVTIATMRAFVTLNRDFQKDDIKAFDLALDKISKGGLFGLHYGRYIAERIGGIFQGDPKEGAQLFFRFIDIYESFESDKKAAFDERSHFYCVFLRQSIQNKSLPKDAWNFFFDKLLTREKDPERMFFAVLRSISELLDDPEDPRVYGRLESASVSNPSMATRVSLNTLLRMRYQFWNNVTRGKNGISEEIIFKWYLMRAYPAPLKDVLLAMRKKAVGSKLIYLNEILATGKAINYDSDGKPTNLAGIHAHRHAN